MHHVLLKNALWLPARVRGQVGIGCVVKSQSRRDAGFLRAQLASLLDDDRALSPPSFQASIRPGLLLWLREKISLVVPLVCVCPTAHETTSVPVGTAPRCTVPRLHIWE